MLRAQSCCPRPRGVTALFSTPQSWILLVTTHRGKSCLTSWLSDFSQLYFTFSFALVCLGATREIFFLQNWPRSREGTAEGLSWQAASVCFGFFSAGTELQPQVPPQGLVVTWANPPSSSCRSHTSSLLFFSPIVPNVDRDLYPQLGPQLWSLWLWGQQKCANTFGKVSCGVCADLCRSLTLHHGP